MGSRGRKIDPQEIKTYVKLTYNTITPYMEDLQLAMQYTAAFVGNEKFEGQTWNKEKLHFYCYQKMVESVSTMLNEFIAAGTELINMTDMVQYGIPNQKLDEDELYAELNSQDCQLAALETAYQKTRADIAEYNLNKYTKGFDINTEQKLQSLQQTQSEAIMNINNIRMELNNKIGIIDKIDSSTSALNSYFSENAQNGLTRLYGGFDCTYNSSVNALDILKNYNNIDINKFTESEKIKEFYKMIEQYRDFNQEAKKARVEIEKEWEDYWKRQLELATYDEMSQSAEEGQKVKITLENADGVPVQFLGKAERVATVEGYTTGGQKIYSYHMEFVPLDEERADYFKILKEQEELHDKRLRAGILALETVLLETAVMYFFPVAGFFGDLAFNFNPWYTREDLGRKITEGLPEKDRELANTVMNVADMANLAVSGIKTAVKGVQALPKAAEAVKSGMKILKDETGAIKTNALKDMVSSVFKDAETYEKFVQKPELFKQMDFMKLCAQNGYKDFKQTVKNFAGKNLLKAGDEYLDALRNIKRAQENSENTYEFFKNWSKERNKSKEIKNLFGKNAVFIEDGGKSAEELFAGGREAIKNTIKNAGKEADEIFGEMKQGFKNFRKEISDIFADEYSLAGINGEIINSRNIDSLFERGLKNSAAHVAGSAEQDIKNTEETLKNLYGSNYEKIGGKSAESRNALINHGKEVQKKGKELWGYDMFFSSSQDVDKVEELIESYKGLCKRADELSKELGCDWLSSDIAHVSYANDIKNNEKYLDKIENYYENIKNFDKTVVKQAKDRKELEELLKNEAVKLDNQLFETKGWNLSEKERESLSKKNIENLKRTGKVIPFEKFKSIEDAKIWSLKERCKEIGIDSKCLKKADTDKIGKLLKEKAEEINYKFSKTIEDYSSETEINNFNKIEELEKISDNIKNKKEFKRITGEKYSFTDGGNLKFIGAKKRLELCEIEENIFAKTGEHYVDVFSDKINLSKERKKLEKRFNNDPKVIEKQIKDIKKRLDKENIKYNADASLAELKELDKKRDYIKKIKEFSKDELDTLGIKTLDDIEKRKVTELSSWTKEGENRAEYRKLFGKNDKGLTREAVEKELEKYTDIQILNRFMPANNPKIKLETKKSEVDKLMTDLEYKELIGAEKEGEKLTYKQKREAIEKVYNEKFKNVQKDAASGIKEMLRERYVNEVMEDKINNMFKSGKITDSDVEKLLKDNIIFKDTDKNIHIKDNKKIEEVFKDEKFIKEHNFKSNDLEAFNIDKLSKAADKTLPEIEVTLTKKSRSEKLEQNFRKNLMFKTDELGNRIYSNEEIDKIINMRNSVYEIKNPDGTTIKLERHGWLKNELPNKVQSHHLNQDKMFNDFVDREDAIAIGLTGNAASDGEQHYKVHQYMEQEFIPYRTGDNPTIPLEKYNEILEGALKHAGFSEETAKAITELAKRQQEFYKIPKNADLKLVQPVYQK